MMISVAGSRGIFFAKAHKGHYYSEDTSLIRQCSAPSYILGAINSNSKVFSVLPLEGPTSSAKI